MKRPVKNSRFSPKEVRWRQRWQLFKKLALGLGLVLSSILLFNTITMISASSKSVDAFFVLGGSIKREIYVAQLARQHPQTPILISRGSPEPCLWLIFEQQAVDRMQNVWLEECAGSTFENLYYGIPILRGWGVHKVKLITSPTHLPRAKWMAQILFGAQGIWVETEIVQEQGVPGNRESRLKTALDVTRCLLWAGLSPIIQPQCSSLKKLVEVNITDWQRQGFKCEHQGKLGRGRE
ncbi:hypothetical protein NUACC21_68000 [Scytonema sp. NUACC21]